MVNKKTVLEINSSLVQNTAISWYALNIAFRWCYVGKAKHTSVLTITYRDVCFSFQLTFDLLIYNKYRYFMQRTVFKFADPFK